MSSIPRRGIRPAPTAAKIGVSLPTLWRYVRNNPHFPRPRKLSERVTVFDETEIDAFLAAPKFEPYAIHELRD